MNIKKRLVKVVRAELKKFRIGSTLQNISGSLRPTVLIINQWILPIHIIFHSFEPYLPSNSTMTHVIKEFYELCELPDAETSHHMEFLMRLLDWI